MNDQDATIHEPALRSKSQVTRLIDVLRREAVAMETRDDRLEELYRRAVKEGAKYKALAQARTQQLEVMRSAARSMVEERLRYKSFWSPKAIRCRLASANPRWTTHELDWLVAQLKGDV